MEESDSGQQQKRCPCGFWGSPQTSGLCSKCYKATVQEKRQDALDPKAELMRSTDRQSAYTSQGATSTSFLTSSLTQTSATSMEKAEELLRQAVKNSSVELNTNKANISSGSSETLKNPDVSISPSTSTSQTVSSVSVNTDKCDISEDKKDSKTEDTESISSKLASPEKRGVKRDSSAIDDCTPESTPEKPGTKSKKRCAVCKCKLELAQRTIGKCKCDNVYCSLHRLPELHDCQFDHKEDGRREARTKMVKPTRHLGTSFKRLDSDS